MYKDNDNVGKCGHARCAGGHGCMETGTPMCSYEDIKQELDQLAYEENLRNLAKRLEDKGINYR